MPNWRYQPSSPARGTYDGAKRKIAISFDSGVFAEISKRALANKRSFRAEVEVLCETALREGINHD